MDILYQNLRNFFNQMEIVKNVNTSSLAGENVWIFTGFFNYQTMVAILTLYFYTKTGLTRQAHYLSQRTRCHLKIHCLKINSVKIVCYLVLSFI